MADGRLGLFSGLTARDIVYLREVYVTTSLAFIPDPTSDAVLFDYNCPSIYRIGSESIMDADNAQTFAAGSPFHIERGFYLTADQANTLRRNPLALPKIRTAFLEYAFEDGASMRAYLHDVKRRTGFPFETILGLAIPITKEPGLVTFQAYSSDRKLYGGASVMALDHPQNRLIGYIVDPERVAQVTGRSLDSLL